ENMLLPAPKAVHADIEFLSGTRRLRRSEKIIFVIFACARRSGRGILCGILYRDWIQWHRVGNLIPGKRLARPVGIVRREWVIDREAVRGEVTGPLSSRGNAIVTIYRQRLVRAFIIAEEEQFVVKDRSADGSTILIAVECDRGIRLPSSDLVLLREVFVAGQDIRPDVGEAFAMKIIGP